MLSPAEAAALLGVAPTTAAPDIENAYLARLSTVPESDIETRDRLAAARDALVAAARWQAPGTEAGGFAPVAAPTAATVESAPPPGVPPAPGYAAPGLPSTPGYAAPGFAASGYPSAPGYPPAPGNPPTYGYPPAPGYTAPPAAGYGVAPGYQTAAAPYPPYAPPARRGPSTGAILGWVLGGFGVLVVLIVVAVVVIVNTYRPISPLGNAGAGAGSGDGSANEYVVDGVRVQYSDEGWDFTLTSPQDCPAATVTVGFSSSYDGAAEDEFTDTVSLTAGEPHVYSVPYDASDLQYAFIDAVDCAGGGADAGGDSGSA